MIKTQITLGLVISTDILFMSYTLTSTTNKMYNWLSMQKTCRLLLPQKGDCGRRARACVVFFQVSEVLSQDKCRLSLSGWFHGPYLERPPRHIEPPIPRTPHLPRDVSFVKCVELSNYYTLYYKNTTVILLFYCSLLSVGEMSSQDKKLTHGPICLKPHLARFDTCTIWLPLQLPSVIHFYTTFVNASCALTPLLDGGICAFVYELS